MDAALDVVKQSRLEIARDWRDSPATALTMFFERLSGSERTCSESSSAEAQLQPSRRPGLRKDQAMLLVGCKLSKSLISS